MKLKFRTSQNPGVNPENSGQSLKNIHVQINETIAERNKILPQWEKLFTEKHQVVSGDIHQQLKITIREFKKSMERHSGFFSRKNAA